MGFDIAIHIPEWLIYFLAGWGVVFWILVGLYFAFNWSYARAVN